MFPSAVFLEIGNFFPEIATKNTKRVSLWHEKAPHHLMGGFGNK
jgi:hypothetical protein